MRSSLQIILPVAVFLPCLLSRVAGFCCSAITGGAPPLSRTTLYNAYLESLTATHPTSSDDTSVKIKAVWESAETNNFWGRPRRRDEIVAHITTSLQSIDPSISPEVQVLSDEPPLVVVHNMVSPQMCQQIIDAATQQSLVRSTMGASQDQSEERTSSTAWLEETPSCEYPLRLLAEQVSRITCLPPDHQENLQVVQYQPGQEFQMHTDHLNSFNNLPHKGRLCTCLVYLHAPLSGGETRFYEFGADVPPRQGSAVLFWNTIEKPGSPGYHPEMYLNVDARLRHAGVPVFGGQKWICNRWVHPVPYHVGVRGL